VNTIVSSVFIPKPSTDDSINAAVIAKYVDKVLSADDDLIK